jgi:hypothetical protein
VHGPREVRRPGLEQVTQVRPVDVRHDQVEQFVVGRCGEHLDDVGVAQVRGRQHLPAEPLAEGRLVRERGCDDLERDRPVAEVFLLGEVDDAHPRLRQLPDQPELRKLTGQLRLAGKLVVGHVVQPETPPTGKIRIRRADS